MEIFKCFVYFWWIEFLTSTHIHTHTHTIVSIAVALLSNLAAAAAAEKATIVYFLGIGILQSLGYC
jgi:hypothetical protein